MAVTLATIEDFVRLDHGLAVVSVVRPDATPVGSLVNAGGSRASGCTFYVRQVQ